MRSRAVTPGRAPSRLGLVVGALGLVAALPAAVVGGIGWYYSKVLLAPECELTYPDRVLGAHDGSVTLADSHLTRQPGTWGVQWSGGHAVLGDVTRRGTAGVVRPLLAGVPPPPGTTVVMDAGCWADPLSRGLVVEHVDVPTPLGRAPAWKLASSGHTWVLTVHGRGASEREALRIAPTLQQLGYPVLAISYRNDLGSPSSPDGRYHLGDTEWQDLAAAVRYAVDHGARDVVLYGWSMGGSIIGAFLGRSPLAARVRAVVMDAPVLDWRPTLVQQTRIRGLPSVVADVAQRFTSWRAAIDFRRLDLLTWPPVVRPPTLVIHGSADSTVPPQPARQLAATGAELSWPVHYVEVDGAEHTAAWNVDPEGYQGVVEAFLRQHAPLGRAAAPS